MRKLLHIPHFLILTIFVLGSFLQSKAQSIDKNIFFGMNYWLYYEDENGFYESFPDFERDLASAKLGLYRIGGKFPNTEKDQPGDKDWYVNAIENIQAIGGEPLVQLPIDLTTMEVVEWYNYFNGTKGLNIKYWAIGNEPDPTDFAAHGMDWFQGLYQVDGRHYTWFRGQFRSIATKLREIAPNSIIVGPSFALFYGDLASTGDNPMNTYYEDFILDIGTDTYNGVPILDIFAFNFYDYHTESIMNSRFADLKSLIDQANNGRSSSPLVFAVTETNTKRRASSPVKPWEFKAGQFFSLMLKKTMAYAGAFVTPWSIFESGGSENPNEADFSFYNADGSRRSTMHHLNLLSSNARGNYMSSQQNGAYNSIVTLGMKDEDGYTVMIMNTTDNNFYSYRATLNNTYSSSSADVKIRFDGSVGSNPSVAAEMSGTIAPKSTIVYTISPSGEKLRKFVYADGDDSPVEYILNDPFNGSYFHIINAYSDHYFRPIGGSDMQPIVQDASASTPTFSSYEWSFIISEDGYHNIINKWTNRLIRPINYSMDENAGIEQIINNTTNRDLPSAQWKLEPAGNGEYWIRNRNSGLYMRPSNGSTADEAPIVQNILNRNYSSYKWSLIPRSEAFAQQNESTVGGFNITDLSEEEQFGIKAFPTPVTQSEKLELRYSAKLASKIIRVYNSNGNLIYSETGNDSGTTTIQVDENFKKGIYIVKIGSHITKLIVR